MKYYTAEIKLYERPFELTQTRIVQAENEEEAYNLVRNYFNASLEGSKIKFIGCRIYEPITVDSL